jgi:hypothetical protein
MQAHTFEIPMPTNTQITPLALIRLGMAAGVLLFGVVVWIVHQQAKWTPASSLPAAIRIVQVALAVSAVFAAVFIRGRVAAESDLAKRNSLLITGWAVGEGSALLGGVIFFLTPEWQWYALGLLAMLASFRLLPIPRVA